MQVKELIAELQKLDSELEVWVNTPADFSHAESVKILLEAYQGGIAVIEAMN